MIPLTYDELVVRSNLPRLEARALLEHASGRSREWLIAHGDELPMPAVTVEFGRLCELRRGGTPIAYLVGWREFYGRRLLVGPDVLIPRPETELLIEHALRLTPHQGRVLDLGTGSGCIALSLVCERNDLDILATDWSKAALQIARDNALRLCRDGLERQRLKFLLSDWWDQVPADLRFDLIVSNPPYINVNDRHLLQGDLRFEPRIALTDEGDGMDAFRKIASQAASRLTQAGYLLLEHGFDQAAALSELLCQTGFEQVETHFDAASLPRLTTAKLTSTKHTF